MRIAMMVGAAIAGLWVGDMLGQPKLYWHGFPEETEHWALWTGGCSVTGVLIVLLWPLRERDRRRKTMTRDDDHNPDPNANAARIGRESIDGERRNPRR